MSAPFDNSDFVLDKKAWQKTRFVENTIPAALAPGQVLFRVDRFAFTANNISYAGAGDLLRYWDFFPAAAGLGRIPTMGFGDVVASSHEALTVGTRCFGFYPMSKYLLIEPASAAPHSIYDGVSHRHGIAPAYNQYQPVGHDPIYDVRYEDELMLLRGLFLTSFLADDFLADHDHHGARTALISSASSKTSIALAFCLSQRDDIKTIGLTSVGHSDFVERLALYDEIVTYDGVAEIANDESAVYVDMAGNTKVSREVHEHLGDKLKYSMRIGATHWDAAGGNPDLPGPAREFFFAPGQIKKRTSQWGPAVFQERLGASLVDFLASTQEWLQIERSYGPEAVERVYHATLEGVTSPTRGNIISLWNDEAATCPDS